MSHFPGTTACPTSGFQKPNESTRVTSDRFRDLDELDDIKPPLPHPSGGRRVHARVPGIDRRTSLSDPWIIRELDRFAEFHGSPQLRCLVTEIWASI